MPASGAGGDGRTHGPSVECSLDDWERSDRTNGVGKRHQAGRRQWYERCDVANRNAVCDGAWATDPEETLVAGSGGF